MKIKQFFMAAACVASIIGFAGSANATLITTATLGTLITGYYPNGGSADKTWLTATLGTTSLYSGDTYRTELTLTGLSALGSDFVAGANGSGNIGWAFDLTSTPSSVSQDTGPTISAYNTSGIKAGSFNASSFDLAIYWNANDFKGGSTATFNLYTTGAGQLAFSSSALNSLFSLAHVQNSASCSGWIGNNEYTGSFKLAGGTGLCPGSTKVPEPSDLPMMLYGMGLLSGLLLVAERSRRRKRA